jgi:hypothetical protein
MVTSRLIALTRLSLCGLRRSRAFGGGAALGGQVVQGAAARALDLKTRVYSASQRSGALPAANFVHGGNIAVADTPLASYEAGGHRSKLQLVLLLEMALALL